MPTSERQQVRDELAGGADIVDGDGGLCTAEEVLSDEGNGATRLDGLEVFGGEPQRAEDEAVRLQSEHTLDLLKLPSPGTSCLCDDRAHSPSGRRLDDEVAQFAEVPDADFGDEERDDSASSGAQTLRRPIRDVAEFSDSALNPLAHFALHVGEVRHDIRHGSPTDARSASNIQLRDHGTPSGYRCAN